jgi:zinc protease
MFRVQISKVKVSIFSLLGIFCLLSGMNSFAQEMPPEPSAPPKVVIPAVRERTLPNGLKVAVVERKNVPLVTVSLLVKSGANAEDAKSAGLANMTASLLTKGTKTRSATEIAQEIEFLGANLDSGADWNASNVRVNVMSDKLDRAMAIMADVILNPTFAQSEIDLYKQQTLDELKVNLRQPGTLANYVASRYSFGEHNPTGTPETIEALNIRNIVGFHRMNFVPSESVLIFTGDITAEQAFSMAQKYFGNWKAASSRNNNSPKTVKTTAGKDSVVDKILVVDLPNSGQAAVSYAKKQGFGRVNGKENFFPSSVLNSVLGGGYSARLNQEIRIKRGLSYGAGSSFGYRGTNTNFIATTQTKNESAAEVAELIIAEIERLTGATVSEDELKPRKAVLTGNFSRNLETTSGLAGLLSQLYLYDIKSDFLNNYMENVRGVSDRQIRDFASQNLKGGDIIIVGDYSVFRDDLKKRFAKTPIQVIPFDKLKLESESLQ